MKKKPSNKIEHLYQEVSSILVAARNTVYRAANFEMVKAYWHIGQKIVEEEQQGEDRATYGKSLIKQLAKQLTQKFGKGYNTTNLKYMRQFYITFQNSHALSDQLSWTHYRLLLKLENKQARTFYINETASNNWSTRTLERQITNLYYQRLLSSTDKDLVKEEAEEKQIALSPKDHIKDPYILDFLGLKDNTNFRESELELSIINNLQAFILELGKGFAFVSRQYRISLEEEHFYIDLVFYNYILKCFLLIDLKTGKLTHQDIGQMDTYIRIFEDKVRQEDDNPTIGLILCSEKNKALAKYSLLNDSQQLYASKYFTYLPTEEVLQNEIERGRQQLEIEQKLNEAR